MKHSDSYAVKLHIIFPCLITCIILKQHPNTVHADEIKSKNPCPLTLEYIVFAGTHVPNIMVPRNKIHTYNEIFSSMSKATKEDILHELFEVSKGLQATITSSTIGKKKVDDWIMLLMNEEDEEKEVDCE